jgi:hypothetical protein
MELFLENQQLAKFLCLFLAAQFERKERVQAAIA